MYFYFMFPVRAWKLRSVLRNIMPSRGVLKGIAFWKKEQLFLRIVPLAASDLCFILFNIYMPRLITE